MDLFLSKCLDFIALEGAQGTTLEALWTYLAKDETNQILDEYIKSYVWDLLQQQSELQIKSSNNSAVSGHIPYDEAVKLKVTITAPKNVREYMLGVTDPSMAISEVQLGLLERIGKYREKGIVQSKLSEVTGIEPRNMYHHVKKLEVLGLIRRLEVLAALRNQEKKVNTSTKLIILPRFAHYHSLPNTGEADEYVEMPSQYMREVCKLLKRAKDNILIEADIVESLPFTRKKAWRDLRARLKEGGYIQLVNVAVKGKEKEVTGIKLLKDYPAYDEDEEEDEDEEASTGPVELVAERSVEQQCYHIIHERGTEGITQTELSNVIGLSRKVTASIVDNLHKVYGIYKSKASTEILKKQITYRLYTQPPPLDEEERRERHTPFAISSEGTSNALIAVVPASEPPYTPPPSSSSSSSYHVPPSPSPSPSLAPPPTPYAALEGIKRVVKVFPITQDARKRRKAMLDILEEHKIITLKDLVQIMADAERQEKGRVLDRKTIDRLISLLEKEKIVQSFRLSLPRVSGDYKLHHIIMLNSISKNSPEMEDFLRKLKEKTNYSFGTRNKQQGPIVPFARPTVHVEEIDRLVVKKEEEGEEKEKEMAPIAVAMKYGFVRAKMPRAKMFHNYIWGLANDTNQTDLGLTEIVQKFPLDLFLTVIGQTAIVPGLEGLMGSGLTIDQLPENIRQALFYRRNFVRRMNVLLDVLLKLKLIARKDDEVIIVSADATIKDITQTPEVMRTYHFASTTDIMLYWTELEYIALHKVEQEEEELEPTEAVRTIMVEGLPELHLRPAWNLAAFKLSRQQRAVLEKATAAPQSREEYQQLAGATGLSPAQVARYFKRGKKRALKKSSEEPETPAQVEKDKSPKKQKTKKEQKKKEEGGFIVRTKWTPIEELNLLKVFIAEMNQTEGWKKLDPLALVPPQSSEIWETISKFTGKPGVVCFRRVKTLTVKFPEPRRMVQIAKGQAINPSIKPISLPSTFEELHKLFEVQVLAPKRAQSTTVALDACSSALPDILRMVLHAPENESSTALALHLFSNFTEEEIVENFEKLTKAGYITRARQSGVARGYQFSNAYNRIFKDIFPPKLFEEQNAFKTLIRMQLPKQPPLALLLQEDEDEDISLSPSLSQFLQVGPMCSGGAVSQCLKYLIDETVKITPIVPKPIDEVTNDEVDKNGRGGVKDHLMLFRTESDAPIPGGDLSSRTMRKLFGNTSDVIMIRQFGWKMIIEKGNSYESNLEGESIPIKKINTNNNNNNIHNNDNDNNKNNEESTKNKRKEPVGEQGGEETTTKRRKVDNEKNVEFVMDNIQHSGVSGVTFPTLQELHPEIDSEELNRVLKILQEKKRILEVDDQKERRYVADEYANRWYIAPAVYDASTQQTKLNESKEFVRPRPWLTLTGEINKKLIKSLQSRLLFAIYKNPGICDTRLYDLLRIISPVAVDELLDSLIKEGKITSRSHASPSSSLFSSFDVPWSSGVQTAEKMSRSFYSTKLV